MGSLVELVGKVPRSHSKHIRSFFFSLCIGHPIQINSHARRYSILNIETVITFCAAFALSLTHTPSSLLSRFGYCRESLNTTEPVTTRTVSIDQSSGTFKISNQGIVVSFRSRIIADKFDAITTLGLASPTQLRYDTMFQKKKK